jgi:hypothetical protein
VSEPLRWPGSGAGPGLAVEGPTSAPLRVVGPVAIPRVKAAVAENRRTLKQILENARVCRGSEMAVAQMPAFGVVVIFAASVITRGGPGCGCQRSRR